MTSLWIVKLLIGFCVLLFHCGGGSGVDPAELSQASAAGGGGTVLTLITAKGLSGHPLAEVVEYTVMVTASDMETWTVVLAPASVVEPLSGIPAGEGRRVVVEGRNVRGDLVQRGVAEDVVIASAAFTSVDVAVAIVPIFTNLRSDATELNTRFRPEVLADPAHAVRILHGTTDVATIPLLDLSIGADVIPVPDTGLTRPHFAPLPAGTYQLAVEDADSGETSTIAVHLLDGTGAQGAPLVSTALAQQRHQFWIGGL